MSNQVTTDIVWHSATVTKGERNKLNNHNSCILWFTGLSGSGKSTIANALEKKLHEMKLQSYILDGDNVRHGLNKDLGFSSDDRKENIRRIGEVSKLFIDAGMITITAFISPFREDRELARGLVENGDFIEIYIKCSLDTCEQRDPKGLYKKARQGKIPDFTGISSPYEEPFEPELVIETDKQSVEESVNTILDYLKTQALI
jgi:adenylylsulfate kinase